MSEMPGSEGGRDRYGGRPGPAGRHRAWRLSRGNAPARPVPLPDVSCALAFRVGGTPAFGPGLYGLLRRFQASGSFAAAAADMGVSYESAWRAVRFCERRLRLRLVRRRGGEAAPGACLTPRGRTILERYAAFACEQAAIVDSLAARLDEAAR